MPKTIYKNVELATKKELDNYLKKYPNTKYLWNMVDWDKCRESVNALMMESANTGIANS